MRALVVEAGFARLAATKLLSFAHAARVRRAARPDPAARDRGSRAARAGLGGAAHAALRPVRQRLQAGVPERAHRQPDDGAGLVPAGAGTRGGGADRTDGPRGAHAPRGRARGAEPLALVRAARAPALRVVPAGRARAVPELHARDAHARASITATRARRPAAWRRCVPAHESQCIPIPDEISDEAAVLADPFAVSLHAILHHPPRAGGAALVYGCGTLGLLAIAILRALHPDVRVLAVARFPHQAELARRFGAETVLPHQPARAVIEGVGARARRRAARAVVRPADAERRRRRRSTTR